MSQHGLSSLVVALFIWISNFVSGACLFAYASINRTARNFCRKIPSFCCEFSVSLNFSERVRCEIRFNLKILRMEIPVALIERKCQICESGEISQFDHNQQIFVHSSWSLCSVLSVGRKSFQHPSAIFQGSKFCSRGISCPMGLSDSLSISIWPPSHVI